MKKHLILFASAVLALAGCSKEAPAVQDEAAMVTFSVALNEATKASADNDGMGAKVDNIKVAVYMHTGNVAEPYKFYDAPEATYDAASKTGTFTVNLIKSQTYQVVVWADKTDRYICDEGLQTIKRASETVASEDEYDAFFATVTYTQGTSAAEVRNIVAKRPFAQINLITTDVKAGFEPTGMTLSYTAASQFNALTDVASVPVAVTRAASAYSTDATKARNTLVMDYILVDGTDAAVLSEVKMTAKVVAVQENVYNNIPVQRNYRTNIIGALLTSPEDFTVVVDPIWTGEKDIQWKSAENIAAANEILAAATAGQGLNIDVNVPDDAATVPVEFTPTNSGSDVALTFGGHSEGTPLTIKFKKDDAATVNPASVTVEAPAGTTLVFETETHVVINGTNYGVISGTFSANTLVINKGVSVDKVIMNAGGLEVHGTLGAFEAAEGHGAIIVRDCEGLSENVYNALSSFIAAGYKGFEQADGTWNISLSDIWFDRVANQPASFILDEVAKTIHLGDENAFAWFGKNSNKFGNKSYKIYLDADMNLESGWWTPISFFFPEDHAIFNGQNHVIKNLKLSGSQNLGLFGGIAGLDIKNLTIDGAIINATSGGYIGTVAYNSYGNFENISVKNTTIFGTYWGIGGVVGFHNAGNLKNCHVENLHITGGCPGGLVGVYNESSRPRVYENCTATSITLKDNRGWGKPYLYGAIVAVVNAPSLTLKNCSSTEMTYVYKSDSNVYHSGDEGIGRYAPSHALYGDGEEVTIE